ncbi:hypothetical protein N836_29520 [Leptolyngbya sp. Heron Island J]|uniref:hypothetical protein n=1 Tax=Leptolyngbya sp. Heron Island J TaxID=1385935 RepID=UPI0003B9AA2D|nr:hypothetical protein [Leptolyngbya sp. Heron Island J]ESA38936.1 hypothetical protein N836_29520 [Leptolyngbya sp. Heron Island J]
MKTLLFGTLTALLCLNPRGEIAQAQDILFPRAEECTAIIEPTLKTDCQETYRLRQVYQNRIEDIHTIYQLAELVQSATVWVVPGYGNTFTFDPPARIIVLQQFVLSETGEPWIHVRFISGRYGFIQTSVVE